MFMRCQYGFHKWLRHVIGTNMCHNTSSECGANWMESGGERDWAESETYSICGATIAWYCAFGRALARPASPSRPCWPRPGTPGQRRSRPARAGNRRFWCLSARRPHTKAPYKTDLHRKTLMALNSHRAARTVGPRPAPPPSVKAWPPPVSCPPPVTCRAGTVLA